MVAKLKVDGKLGPQTRQTLDAYKTKAQLTDRPDQEVFDLIRGEAQRTQKGNESGVGQVDAQLTQLTSTVGPIMEWMRAQKTGGKTPDPTALAGYVNVFKQWQPVVQHMLDMNLDPAQKANAEAALISLDNAIQYATTFRAQPAPQTYNWNASQRQQPTIKPASRLDKLINKYAQYNEDDHDPFDPGFDEEQEDTFGDEGSRSEFADPGGNSSLRAETPDNPRNQPCPQCGDEDVLTPEDVRHGYRCNRCADEAEGLRWPRGSNRTDLLIRKYG
jgi:hypothetical protein